jgi:hypothetical protein
MTNWGAELTILEMRYVECWDYSWGITADVEAIRLETIMLERRYYQEKIDELFPKDVPYSK